LLVCSGLAVAPLIAVPSSAELVINEFLPDPAGSDGGREFVELFNVGPVAVGLDEVVLQFANGAVGAEWAARWHGTGAGSVAPGAYFLIVDRNWLGSVPGDDEAYLGLQNGPDAIRLLRGGIVLDLVGYGRLTDSELFEGTPASLSPGLSLSRRPDGRTTHDNGADFVLAEPTPGGANFMPYSLTVTERVFDPVHLVRPAEPLRVSVTLYNNGTEDLPGGPCSLVWPTGVVDAWWDGTVPDYSRTLSFLLRPDHRGQVPLTWVYEVPERSISLRYDLGSVQVGAADMRLNEVMPAPDQGQGEWIELHWAGAGVVELSGYELRDEDGAWIVLPTVSLMSGEFIVAAQDSAALVNWWWTNREAGETVCQAGGLGPRVMALPGWPSLNNTPPGDRLHADRIYLADPAGVVIDAVAWGGRQYELAARGLSLERIGPEPVNPGATNWTVSTALSGSTPGCVNSVTTVATALADPGTLSAVPPVLEPQNGVTAVHLQFTLGAAEVSWQLRLFNLWGDPVRDFGGDARGPGPRDLVWDGRDDRGQTAPPGAYLVWLETRSETGLVRRRRKIRMVVR